MTTLSLQLYTLRDQLAADADETLAAVAAMGLTEVEPFGIEKFRDWLPETLTRHGLTAPSAHGMAVGDSRDEVLDAAAELGVQTLFVPMVDRSAWADAASLDAIAAQLNDTAQAAAARGLALGYHNHDFEFAHEVNGMSAYEYFVGQLDPAVRLEVDTFWAAFGGQDVPALLDRLGERVTHLHVKDGELKGVRRPNVVVGQGDMNQDGILSAHADKVWVIEFDDCADDVIRCVDDSVKYLKNYPGARA